MKRLWWRLSFVLHAVFGRLEVLPFCMHEWWSRHVITSAPVGAYRLKINDIIQVRVHCTKRRGHLGEHAE